MYLFFDTETTGITKNYKAPVSDSNNWPRLVQIAWLTYDKEENEIESHNYIIKPDQFHIPYEAAQVHGITTEIAQEKGEDLEKILNKFNESLKEAQTLIAHNINFDEKIVRAEFFRKNLEDHVAPLPRICTMQTSTNYCQIPSQYHYSKYKWPTLQELHQKLFSENFDNAHDALADIQACAKCFFELKKRNIIDLTL